MLRRSSNELSSTSFSLSILPESGRAVLTMTSARPYARLHRNTVTSTSSSADPIAPASPTKSRPRRSMSSNSYAVEQPKELTAGQKKAAEDKKASRHADLIDTWDPTGMGSASE